LAPRAPGTFGSLPGLALGAFLYRLNRKLSQTIGMSPEFWATIFLCLIATLDWVAIDRTERQWQTHDDGSIVIDEVAGQAIPIAFLGFELQTLILGFILFRFFDILKPGLIGWCDRELPGAWGTLVDDLLAGICALAIVFVLSTFRQLAL
jgi:phosphatidylglycerophosphatase A